MAKLTEQDFKKEITSKKFKKIYLIYGDEKYLVKKYTSLLINKAVGKEPSDFDLLKIQSDRSLEAIFSAARQISMFSEFKCVLVNDYDIDALSESDYKQLEKFITEEIPDGTILIFSMPTLNKETKKSSSKISKLKKFETAVSKTGTVFKSDKKGDIALEQQLVVWAEKNGCVLNRINAAKIIAMCGTDMMTLKNETDKLSAYANGNEITEDMINILASKKSDVRIFALSNCILKNDFNGAYKQLDILFESNEKPEIILSVLSSTFVDMYRMRVAAESGKKVSDVAKDFNYGKREFVLTNADNNAKKFSTENLRHILDIILNADIKLKSTRVNARILMETLLSELFIAVKEASR